MADAKAELTLIVGNLPRHINRDQVMSWLAASGYGDSYDFLYVPRCFQTNVNKGYMFVNFMRRETAREFAERFHGAATGSGSAQLIVSLSLTQGIEGSLAKLRKSSSRRIKNPQAWAYVRHQADPESSTTSRSSHTRASGEAAARGAVRPPPGLRPAGCGGLAAAALPGRAGPCGFGGVGVAPSVDDVGRAAAATLWADTPEVLSCTGEKHSIHRPPWLRCQGAGEAATAMTGHVGSDASTPSSASSASISSSAARLHCLGAGHSSSGGAAPDGLNLGRSRPPGLFRAVAHLSL